jgi:hypothetical protein
VAVHALAHSGFAGLGDEPGHVILGDQIVQIMISLENHTAAATAIAAAGTALGDERFAMERNTSLPAVTGAGKYLDLVYEHFCED